MRIALRSLHQPKQAQGYSGNPERRGVARVKRDGAFWQAVQAVIARAAAHWGGSLAGRSLLTLSRGLKQIQLLAPESLLLCPEMVAYKVIENFFFFNDWRDSAGM